MASMRCFITGCPRRVFFLNLSLPSFRFSKNLLRWASSSAHFARSTFISALFSSRSLSALILAATVLFQPLPPFTPLAPSPSFPLRRWPSTMFPANSSSDPSPSSPSPFASIRRSIRFTSSDGSPAVSSSAPSPGSPSSGAASRAAGGGITPPFPSRRLAIARISALVSVGSDASCDARRRAYSSGSNPSGLSISSLSRSCTLRYLFTLPAMRARRLSRTTLLS
mmetsp:Transcript_4946/g.20376  ORF Transcript_4946/g.20376 Transcript_4946/m.20376 type:complete len:224 (-) Transcript_4946:299-970(-)